MERLFANKWVVVTGASSGIGQAIALAFASHGAQVVIQGNRNLSGLFQTAQQIVSAGGSPLCITADIRNPDSAMGMVNTAFTMNRQVDVWVNAAGADVLTGSVAKSSFENKFDLLWQTDVRGTVFISRAVADRMLTQAERVDLPVILNVGWDQSERGIEGDSGQLFSTTKAAVAAFSRSLAMSVGPRIRVNCLAPGWIQTAWGNLASDKWDRRARSESCLDRWGTPEDVAQTAIWIASPAASFINGQSIAINGGWKPNHPEDSS